MFKKLNIIQKLGLIGGGISIISLVFNIILDWFQHQWEYLHFWDEYFPGFILVFVLTSLWVKYLDDNGIEKVKSLFNKYCDFIGVENDGLKRLLIVGLVSTTLFSIGIFTIPFLIMVYLLSLFIQLINWIIDGFKK